MEAITTLLSCGSSLNERKTIANNVIAQYDLPFSVNEVMIMVNYCLSTFVADRASNFVYLLLTTNLRLFIAITYAMLDNKVKYKFWSLALLERTMKTNFRSKCDDMLTENNVQEVYCALYDYYEFDISDLVLPNGARVLIQMHIDGKVSYVKRAIKK